MTGKLAELARRFQDVIDHITDKPFTWGQGDGTLSDQTDLQTALDGKVDKGVPQTYIPEYIPASGSFADINYSIQDGRYIIQGKVINIWVRIRTTGAIDLGTASGELRITPPIPIGDFVTARNAVGIFSDFATSFDMVQVELSTDRLRLINGKSFSTIEVSSLDTSATSNNNFLAFHLAGIIS